MELLSNAGIFALASLFMGVVPLAMGVAYAIWPSDARLELMRPLSLATIFAAVSGTAVGLLNTLRFVAQNQPIAFNGPFAIGLAESLITLFFDFGCLTAAWLFVAVGLWRRTP
jgi:hypothetical protein